jgi:hypothetical protein
MVYYVFKGSFSSNKRPSERPMRVTRKSGMPPLRIFFQTVSQQIPFFIWAFGDLDNSTASRGWGWRNIPTYGKPLYRGGIFGPSRGPVTGNLKLYLGLADFAVYFCQPHMTWYRRASWLYARVCTTAPASCCHRQRVLRTRSHPGQSHFQGFGPAPLASGHITILIVPSLAPVYCPCFQRSRSGAPQDRASKKFFTKRWSRR